MKRHILFVALFVVTLLLPGPTPAWAQLPTRSITYAHPSLQDRAWDKSQPIARHTAGYMAPTAPTSNSWETRAPMPTPRGNAASAVLYNTIYVIGGWTTQDSAVVEAYDPSTNSWSTKVSMPTPRNGLATAVVNGKIYAIGGWSGTANTNAVEVYDPVSNTWSSAAPLPIATVGLGAAAVGGKIYVFGGWRATGTTNAVLMYDPATNSWTSRSSMPTARDDLAVVVVAGKIFALGGKNPDTLDTVEIFNPMTNSWTPGVSLPISRNAFTATNIGGKIYIAGSGDSTHLRFDPATGIWQTLAPLPTRRWDPVAEIVAGKEYVIGGWSDAGDPNANEAYTPPAASTPVVSVIGSPGAAALQPVLNAFVDQNGFVVAYRQNDDLWTFLLDCQTHGTCPDVAIVPNPGLIKQLAQRGALEPLDPVIPSFDTYYAATWRHLGSVGGTLVGLPIDVSSKSMVWYRPQTLAGIGATPPDDWADLLSLADDFVADGQTPFAIGAESGAASGWPLTDIFENLLVRTGGPEVQRRLVDHRIAWTDPAVVTAMQRFADIIGNDTYVAGGAAGILTTSFSDAIDMVLGDTPSANMYFGATWVQWYIDPGLTPLVDYNYFPFPKINPTLGNPMTGTADLAVLFEDSNAAQAFMQFLATPTAGELWVTSTNVHISPNNGVNLAVYTNPITRAVAQELLTASDFLFDLDDQLPYELQTYLWEQLMYFVAHQDQIPVVLQRLEQRATELQAPPYAVFLPLAAQTNPPIQKFLTLLNNENAATDGVTNVAVRTQGNTVFVHEREQCASIDCDRDNALIARGALPAIATKADTGDTASAKIASLPGGVRMIDAGDGCQIILLVGSAAYDQPGNGSTAIMECGNIAPELTHPAQPPRPEDVPPAPTLLSPANTSTLNTLLPRFFIDAGVSNVQISPNIWVSRYPNFSQLSAGVTFCGWTQPQSQFSYLTSQNLAPNTRYYWRARSAYGDACGNPNAQWGAWSPTWTFVTGAGGVILPAPALAFPVNGSMVSEIRPTLTWQAVPGAVGTRISGRPVEPIIDPGDFGWGTVWELGVVTSAQVYRDLTVGQTYEWYVQFRNDYAWGNQSERWRFMISPTMTVNFTTGAPGSYFLITGSGFPPYADATISANGVVLGTTQTDNGGEISFLLATPDADPGRYIVTAAVNPVASTNLRLSLDQPIRPPEGSGPIFNVPTGIAFDHAMFLPFTLFNRRPSQ